jgi:hypothetical protein
MTEIDVFPPQRNKYPALRYPYRMRRIRSGVRQRFNAVGPPTYVILQPAAGR